MNWQVYILLCSDGTFYTGITTDISRRMRQHASGRGAKYFRGRRPKALLFLEGGHDKSTASKRELSIKGLSRAGKKALIDAAAPEIPPPFNLPSEPASANPPSY